MRNSITVMNAKGGVGKSSLVLTLAETLSAHHGKKVLVIDSDAHASISTMLISPDWLTTIQGQSRTFVDYLIAVVLKTGPASQRSSSERIRRRRCALDRPVAGRRASDAARARSPRAGMRRHCGWPFLSWLKLAMPTTSPIDSAPGLSVLTECWPWEADLPVPGQA
jgi:chromosome partitioning protein